MTDEREDKPSDGGSDGLWRWLVGGLAGGVVVLGLLVAAYTIGHNRGQDEARSTSAPTTAPATTEPAATTPTDNHASVHHHDGTARPRPLRSRRPLRSSPRARPCSPTTAAPPATP